MSIDELLRDQRGPTATINPYTLEMIADILKNESDRLRKEMSVTVSRTFVRGCLDVIEKLTPDACGQVEYCIDRLKHALEVPK